MTTSIVCYADATFEESVETLIRSATAHGVDRTSRWSSEKIKQSSLYRFHRQILDEARGSGYWLWKPFIIDDALADLAPDDVLVYSDAGIEVVGDLHPLFTICRQLDGLMLFGGTYDDVGAPGPNSCGKWTKRDCFVYMGLDERRYHLGTMLDASFIVMQNRPHVRQLIREWLLYSCQYQLISDSPNVCGLSNISGFLAHRHDQSILSLLALREGRSIFRHPGQFANHRKEARFRETNEWTWMAYGVMPPFDNSPYGTLLNHHRGRDRRRLRVRTSAQRMA